MQLYPRFFSRPAGHEQCKRWQIMRLIRADAEKARDCHDAAQVCHDQQHAYAMLNRWLAYLSNRMAGDQSVVQHN